jgi:hypothetical protein
MLYMNLVCWLVLQKLSVLIIYFAYVETMTRIKSLWPFSVQILLRIRRAEQKVSRCLIPNFMNAVIPPPFRTDKCVLNSED